MIKVLLFWSTPCGNCDLWVQFIPIAAGVEAKVWHFEAGRITLHVLVFAQHGHWRSVLSLESQPQHNIFLSLSTWQDDLTIKKKKKRNLLIILFFFFNVFKIIKYKLGYVGIWLLDISLEHIEISLQHLHVNKTFPGVGILLSGNYLTNCVNQVDQCSAFT